ncbi:uncharacterized protein LOC110861098 [Folsomia candida]|uniref:Ejaculatory bulb-specific protein 3 n=1 Tax=Folsomia candida TaxID=158441 RepID=A0A226D489_FOLCA|nr:uncharacterized protein LOC110861098 [Folsomia candida]OXA39674.1 Ejaculatory bulb-specific protein 3 [Folsomia candida]
MLGKVRIAKLCAIFLLNLNFVGNIFVGGELDENGRYFLPGKKYPLTLLPILDELDVPSVFRRTHYLKFIFKCVFFEGHCDLIGKWLKPRAMAALFGTCLGCTPFQERNLERWLLGLIDANPTLFRAAMVKVCVDMDVPVGQEDFALLGPFLPTKNS